LTNNYSDISSYDTAVLTIEEAGGQELVLHLAGLGLGEDLPEPECLVAGAGDDGRAVGAHREVEHAHGVAGEDDHLLHGGVLPDVDLVEGVAVRADQLVHVFGEEEVADLRAGVDRVDLRRVAGVPEADHPVRGATAGGEQPVLVRRPRDRLDRGLVLLELDEGVLGVQVPDEELVVVAAGGELLVVVGPLQATDLLLVRWG
jgi:hypothetical protein